MNVLEKMVLPNELKDIVSNCKGKIVVPKSREHLMELSLGGADNKTYDVNYELPGKGLVREAYVTRCKNGIVANYDDPNMRRRDPNSMVIADKLPTDKTTHEERFGTSFDAIRKETFEWLKNVGDLLIMPFYSGNSDLNLGYPSIIVMPANAAFFALSLADLQGIIPEDEVPDGFKPRAVVYVAPPFRLMHYNGEQVVVHNRLENLHEVFSFNLYPGPSAKKGIYSVLLNIGEQEGWVTLHAATVTIVSKTGSLTILHEGASGGGKSEMTEVLHTDGNGRILLATNTVTSEKVYLRVNNDFELHPLTDDMALAHPSLQNNSKKLVVADAEDGWFVRVDHITEYGTDPTTEKRTIHPEKPLVFINMDAKPDSTCLIWEPIMDAPGKPCSNPRVIIPRTSVEGVLKTAAEVDVRSFGLRTPPTTKEMPNYGIVGLFHVLSPALAWLWRLAAPRGHANPSILDSVGMVSEGVGSYWPFATGKMVTQANLLLDQVVNTPLTKYVLIPNQYIGAYKVGFYGQWAVRQFLTERGGLNFSESELEPSRCSVLGYSCNDVNICGTQIDKKFLMVENQPEVGVETYDKGALMLLNFFKEEISKYLTPDLSPLGKQIIEACLSNVSAKEYYDLIKF